MRVCQLVMSPSATLCHPLLGVVNKNLETAALWTPFSLIFKGFQDMSPKKGQDTYPEQNCDSLGNLVLGLGLVFTKKI